MNPVKTGIQYKNRYPNISKEKKRVKRGFLKNRDKTYKIAYTLFAAAILAKKAQLWNVQGIGAENPVLPTAGTGPKV
jgi:hypothetical protein